MNNDIEMLEMSLEQAREVVKKRDTMLRLLKNEDFIEMFTDGYMLHEASRLVLLKASPHMQKPEDQATLDKGIIGIGEFREYVNTVIAMGNTAAKGIEADEQTLQEIRAEEA